MLRYLTLLFVALIGMTQVTIAAEEEAPWSHAEIHLAADEQITDPVSQNQLNTSLTSNSFPFYQDLLDWLSGQPQIKRVYDDVPTPKLLMFREGKSEPQETLFISHVPGSLTKRILSEKNLVRKGKYDDDQAQAPPDLSEEL